MYSFLSCKYSSCYVYIYNNKKKNNKKRFFAHVSVSKTVQILEHVFSGPPETRNKPMTYEVVFFYSKQKSGDQVKKCRTDIDVFVLDKLLGAGACANSLIDKTFFPLEHKFSSCLSSDPAYCLYMQPNISQRAL